MAADIDWHAFCGSSICAIQSADSVNSQIAWKIEPREKQS